jgi:hypothetical protein
MDRNRQHYFATAPPVLPAVGSQGDSEARRGVWYVPWGNDPWVMGDIGLPATFRTTATRAGHLCQLPD